MVAILWVWSWPSIVCGNCDGNIVGVSFIMGSLAREIVNNSGGGGGGGRGNGVVDVIGVRRLPLERGVRSSVNESADLELSWIFV
ncbi:hypothetical protein CMV_015460 [Castanea mollissima]|uniref:Secreted protein n=1 Tax=Castanea mollissima TaxID=60419 RepID=A0A8J4VK07_9ROSI|nr:hypothetical protein CMV_015460 [Castanea mollissima]